MNPMALMNRLPNPARFARRLDDRRRAAVDGVLAAHPALVAEARDACAELLAGPARGAEARVDASARILLEAIREVGDDGDVTVNVARYVDRALRSERLELLDREAVPASMKRLTMRMLHAVNVALDSYGVWAGALDLALGSLDEAHVYDLAAGTGGFMRHVAKQQPHGARRLRLTSTDLEPTYVAMGERMARREGLDITFEPCDASDLRHANGVSIFVCTQATHHLSPGQIVQMIAGAVRRAPRGILIVDLQRSLFNMFATASVLATVMQPLLHDGVLSVQRSYAPAELVLLARLAGAKAITTYIPSATYTVMHAMASAQPP